MFLNESQLGNKVLLFANLWTPEFLLASPYFVCSETTSDCIQFYCLLSVLTHDFICWATLCEHQHETKTQLETAALLLPVFSLEISCKFLSTSTIVRRLRVLCFVYSAYGRYMWKTDQGVSFFFKFNNLYVADCRSVVPLFEFRSGCLPLTCWNQSFEI